MNNKITQDWKTERLKDHRVNINYFDNEKSQMTN